MRAYSWKKHTNARRDKSVKISYISSSSHYIYCSATKVVFGVLAVYVVGVVAVVVLAVDGFFFSSSPFSCSFFFFPERFQAFPTTEIFLGHLHS